MASNKVNSAIFQKSSDFSNLFQAFRQEGYPSVYPETKHPVYGDLVIYGFLFTFLILLFSFIVVVPGIRGPHKFYVLIRFTLSLFLGAVILICNFGQEWEVSSITTKTAYKAYTHHEIHAHVGIKIGLRSVNITLKEVKGHKNYERKILETIDYNERFSWEWNQGRNGFGSQAGQIQRDFRAAQSKGLPFPILWIAEYFTFDGEGIRFGRHYRTAGWYSHIMMWLAFPLWILSNILFQMVVQFGAIYLFLTGASLLTANIIFASVRNFLPLEVPFEDATLRMKYGWTFYLNLFTGLGSCIIAVIIFWLDLKAPDSVATFFGLDVLQDYEDFYADPVDLNPKFVPMGGNEENQSSGPSDKEAHGLRRRTRSFHLKRIHTKRAPPPTTFNRDEDPESCLYENVQVKRFDPIGEEEDSSNVGEASNMGSTEMILMTEYAGLKTPSS